MELSSWLIIAYTLTVLGVIGTVLSENRNPLKASAWILIVGLIPVFGIMVYIVFGQDQKRLNSINRRFYRRLMLKPHTTSLPPTGSACDVRGSRSTPSCVWPSLFSPPR